MDAGCATCHGSNPADGDEEEDVGAGPEPNTAKRGGDNVTLASGEKRREGKNCDAKKGFLPGTDVNHKKIGKCRRGVTRRRSPKCPGFFTNK